MSKDVEDLSVFQGAQTEQKVATKQKSADAEQGSRTATEIIFFGNGPLSEAVLEVLKEAKDEKTGEPKFEVIFQARNKADLERVKELKKAHPEAHGVLASYGVMIRGDVLNLFEPEGILNVHPSLLPKYRGASPIESAILAGDTEFGVSVMKLAPGMDAGPIYWQGVVPEVSLGKLAEQDDVSNGQRGTPDEKKYAAGEQNEAQDKRKKAANEPGDIKSAIYRGLGEAGARWIAENLANLPKPMPQDDTEAIFTEKLTKEMGILDHSTDTAEEIWRKIVAFQGFPKAKYAFFGQNCIILEAHVVEQGERAVLAIPCSDGRLVAVDRLQPEGRRPMDAKSFVNGYGKR